MRGEDVDGGSAPWQGYMQGGGGGGGAGFAGFGEVKKSSQAFVLRVV